MTDNEIIKAFQVCTSERETCVDCPLNYFGKKCGDFLEEQVLDLINRQQAEIERYLHSIKLLENDVATAKSEAIKWFAEKLKMECYATYDEVLPSLFADIIDKLVKEMTEVNENDRA